MMQEQIDKIEKKVDTIHEALVGNPLEQKQGLIEKVQKNTKYRKGAIKRLTLVSGFFTGLGVTIKYWIDKI